jgi:hypothetical protein
MKAWLGRGGFWLLCALLFLAVMMVFSMTPVVWNLEGRPAESYPELFFWLYGVPVGLLLVVVALVNLWLKRKR